MSSLVASIPNDPTMPGATVPTPWDRIARVEPPIGVIDFDRFEVWPDISEMLSKRSVSMLRRKGFHGWVVAGGTTTPQGSVTFGNPSYVARRTLLRLEGDGVRYTDGRMNWGLRLTENSRGKPGIIRGIGLGADFDVRWLCRPRRWAMIRQLDAELHEATQPCEFRDAADWRQIDRLRGKLRQLALLNAGLAIVPRLVSEQTGAAPAWIAARELAAAAWGTAASVWPADWRNELVEALTLLERLAVQTVVLRKSGWCPKATSRGPVILGLQARCGMLRVRMSRLFLRFFICLVHRPPLP
jgi:hypothetical protein